MTSSATTKVCCRQNCLYNKCSIGHAAATARHGICVDVKVPSCCALTLSAWGWHRQGGCFAGEQLLRPRKLACHPQAGRHRSWSGSAKTLTDVYDTLTCGTDLDIRFAAILQMLLR